MRSIITPKAALFVGAFLAIEGILLAFYQAHQGLHEVLAFGATVVAGAFALFDLFSKTQHGRLESAGDFIKRWNDPGLGEVRREVRALLTNATLIAPLIKKSED